MYFDQCIEPLIKENRMIQMICMIEEIEMELIKKIIS